MGNKYTLEIFQSRKKTQTVQEKAKRTQTVQIYERTAHV